MEKKYELTSEIALVTCGYMKNGEYKEGEKRGPEPYDFQYPTLLFSPGKDCGECIGVVHRIRALRDIPEIGVKAGDLGGFIEDEDCLSHYGSCWVSDNSVVYNGGVVRRDAHIREMAVIDGSTVDSNAEVSGKALILYGAYIGMNVKIYDSAVVYRGSVYDSIIRGDACVISAYGQDTFENRDIATGIWMN